MRLCFYNVEPTSIILVPAIAALQQPLGPFRYQFHKLGKDTHADLRELHMGTAP